jgi:transaldolase
MSITDHDSELGRKAQQLARAGRAEEEGRRPEAFPTHPLWRRLRELGTELWLDSGDVEAIADVWTREFTGLTTNNTLLSREIQKGAYDRLIDKAVELLDEYPLLSSEEWKLEIAFILNTHHALQLVQQFGAFVSVEEHTNLTDDLEGAINYARRFHAICPGSFYVKIPFSAAGLLATRRVSDEGIAVNHTLGFSARQNHLIARLARPAFVNVFLGRLNSVVADNGLGSGEHVGERATLASQAAVRELRERHGIKTRQIAASLREGRQVADLAGVDVITMPPKVAREFLESGIEPGDLRDMTAETFDVGVDAEKARHVGIDALWEVNEEVAACAAALEQERLDMFTPVRLRGFCQRHGCADVLVKWTEEQVAASAEEGKIPSLDTWRAELEDGRVAIDSLMSLAGWNSFRYDQEAMDHHVEEVMAAARK